MGTSGSYGGSGKSDWRKARDAARRTFGGGGGGDGPGEDGSPPPPLGDRPDFLELLHRIGDGLRADDPELRRPGGPAAVPLDRVLAAGPAIAGLPFLGHAGGRGRTRERPVVAGARRTGAALGGGFAVRAGDGSALAELGLDLAELSDLSPRDQTQRIIDRVFGASADENEQAFREAAAIILLRLLESPDGIPDYQAVICDAATEVVYRRALVEIHAQVIAGALSADEVGDRERQIREYIGDLIRAQPAMRPSEGVPSPSECSQSMAEVTAIAVDALRDAKGEPT